MTRDRLRDHSSAELIDRLVDDLGTVLHDDAHRLLTVDEAAQVANRCRSSIRKYIAAGRLTNLGRPYAPRVNLGELRGIYPDV